MNKLFDDDTLDKQYCQFCNTLVDVHLKKCISCNREFIQNHCTPDKVMDIKVLRVYSSTLEFNLMMVIIVVISLLIPIEFSSVTWILIIICAWIYEENKIKHLKYEYGFEINEPVKIKRINPPSLWISAVLWMSVVLIFVLHTLTFN